MPTYRVLAAVLLLFSGAALVTEAAQSADFRDRATFLFRPQLLPSILRNSLVFQPSEV